MDLDTARITFLKRLAAGEDHTLAAEDPLRALGLVEGAGDQVQITDLGRAYLDALPRVEGEKTGGMRFCQHFAPARHYLLELWRWENLGQHFAPARHYRPGCGDFCVQKICRHWVPERSVCIEADPAGNTYEVTEAHCGLLDEVGSDA